MTTRIYGCALRGRYDGGSIKQHLEVNSSDFSNCLTTVQKDTLLLIIKDRKEDTITVDDN